MHRSSVTRVWIDSWIKDKTIYLPSDTAHRFMRVVRVKPTEFVGLFDGSGREVLGKLKVDQGDNRCRLIDARLEEAVKNKPELILVQAALDEAKMSQCVQRSTEFGVDKIIIFQAEKSEAFCYNKLEKKLSRLQAIAIDACRQSGRRFVPEIVFSQDIYFVIESNCFAKNFGVFGLLDAHDLLSKKLIEKAASQEKFVLVVGPEGGLSFSEIKALEKCGLNPVRWAPFTLRSEVAGLFGLALFQSFLGRA